MKTVMLILVYLGFWIAWKSGMIELGILSLIVHYYNIEMYKVLFENERVCYTIWGSWFVVKTLLRKKITGRLFF